MPSRPTQRQIHLAGFLIAGPVVHSHAVWRHPDTVGDFREPEYYVRAVKSMERGLFDFAFFADRLGVADTADGSRDLAFERGSQDSVRFDPIPILSYLIAFTSRIGLGATRSTTYFEPAHVARGFGTLDVLSKGRVAWNVVTSMNDSEGRIFGKEQHLAHDLRYDRADEFVEATFALWDSWDDDALVLDKKAGRFADPRRIRPVKYQGRWIKVDGPLNIPRGPQGRPVILQAGSSSHGRRFGGRWADAIFTIQTNLAAAQQNREDIRASAIEADRDPDAIKVLTAIMPFVGTSVDDATRRRDAHNALASVELGVATLSSQLNTDFGRFDVDTPVAVLLDDTSIPAHVREKLAGMHERTLGDIAKNWSASVRVPQWVGTGEQIADQMQQWFEAGACDGFVISPAYLPGSFDEFVDHVVPVLQARGLYRTAYTGHTLREHLGLARPNQG